MKCIPDKESCKVHYSANPSKWVNIVLIPECYTADEKDKFEKACYNFAEECFNYSPFKDNKSRFNIRAVWAPSTVSGVTIPAYNIWINTAAKAKVWTFVYDSDQTIVDCPSIRDLDSTVHVDCI